MLCGDIVLSKLLDVVFVVGSKRGGGGEGEQTLLFLFLTFRRLPRRLAR